MVRKEILIKLLISNYSENNKFFIPINNGTLFIRMCYTN